MNIRLLAVISAAFLAACEQPVPPVFEEPFPLPVKSEAASLAPHLTRGADDTVLLSWIERGSEGGKLRVAELGEKKWLDATDVVDDPDMFVNWADYPSVSAIEGDGRIAYWLRSSADPVYAYDVMIARSTDGGKTWTEPVSLHSDGTPTEHGFVSTWPAAGGTGFVWLDGRKTVSESDDPTESGMTLRSAIVSRDGEIQNEQLIDGLVCDCCQTDVAVSSRGPIAVYRDRTADEFRDIGIARYIDGSWQPDDGFSADGWQIAACPVNGPAIAAEGDLVAVAWYTAASDSPRVFVRLSTNGGKSFGEKILFASQKVLGQVSIAYIGDDSFAVSWLHDGRELDDIYVKSITSNGEIGPRKIVGRTAAMRTVPEMIRLDDALIFAWTDQAGDTTRLVSATLPIVYAR